MKLSNTIINQIFADAGIKNHRLLNKHHSQYNEMDIEVLKCIKEGKKVKNNYYIPKREIKYKQVLRLEDRKIFESVAECSKETGYSKQQIYNFINNNKIEENRTFMYLEDDE